MVRVSCYAYHVSINLIRIQAFFTYFLLFLGYLGIAVVKDLLAFTEIPKDPISFHSRGVHVSYMEHFLEHAASFQSHAIIMMKNNRILGTHQAKIL